ncbi:TolC family protein [Bacteroidales bacterium OttesenSCG-928-B11]|nr:TolC family protein [Bacteroidales bacterium OttesenSCG-928-C03]MDL2312092.1 TolC family protein [Bacteroidales bacterium OttesenSCG-928-B11]MDL2326062.1 TolC family protein [Bacteroidales bacterium OttesenSCG-928-A14]
MKINTAIFLLLLFPIIGTSQSLWNLERCIEFAIENSTKTRIQELKQNNIDQNRKTAIGSFFPSINGSVGAQSNFGRSIDPETNTYFDVSNLSNSYQLSGSIPIFNAGRLINTLRISKLAQLNGIAETQRVKDEIAIAVIQAYIDLFYFQQLESLSERKLSESRQLLIATRKMEELGTRSAVDRLQMEALVAQDQYLIVHSANQISDAFITLKNSMNYPLETAISIDTVMPQNNLPYSPTELASLFDIASSTNPIAKSSLLNQDIERFNKKTVLSTLLPSLYLYGGVNTYYNKILTGEAVMPSFNNQFINNMGEWVAISLSIPIFDGLYNHSRYKIAKNNFKIAQHQHDEVLRQLHAEISKTLNEKSGLENEATQMAKQIEAAQWAYNATKKRYELGTQSALDLQTASNNLLQAQVNLLQIELQLFLKEVMVEYYRTGTMRNYEWKQVVQ